VWGVTTHRDIKQEKRVFVTLLAFDYEHCNASTEGGYQAAHPTRERPDDGKGFHNLVYMSYVKHINSSNKAENNVHKK